MKNQKMFWGLPAVLLALFLVVPGALAADFAIGLGAGVVPDYEGSDDYEGVILPAVEARFNNGMYFEMLGLNARFNLIPTSWVSWLRLGPVYNYRDSRSDVDNSQVEDLRNVSDANELGAFGGFEYKGWFAFIEWLADTGDAHDGSYGTLKGGYNWQITDAWLLSIGAEGTYASDDYMETYFSIDGDNAARSGLSRYDADGGMKDVALNLGVNWGFAQNWDLRGLVQIKQLVGDADDDSPVTDEGSETQFFGGLLVVFNF